MDLVPKESPKVKTALLVLRRTNEDKRRAVKAALLHPRGYSLSDRKLAEHLGVDHKAIAAMRTSLTGEIPQLRD